jgi:hypothetical protein
VFRWKPSIPLELEFHSSLESGMAGILTKDLLNSVTVEGALAYAVAFVLVTMVISWLLRRMILRLAR